VTYKPGMVLRVPFPFVDSSELKFRPALVLSSEAFNRKHAHVVFAMITTAKHTRWVSDVPISSLDTAGLGVPSMIRFKLFTLDARLIAGSLGRLSPADWKAVRAQLNQILPGL